MHQPPPSAFAYALRFERRLRRLQQPKPTQELLCNVAAWADPTPESVWVVEDDEVVAQIEEHMQKQTVAAGA